MIKKINERDFNEEVLNGTGVMIVDFYADWCGPCRMLGPVIEEVSEEMKSIGFYKVNIDEERSLALTYKVNSIPNVIMFKDGRFFERKVGFTPKDALKNWIQKNE